MKFLTLRHFHYFVNNRLAYFICNYKQLSTNIWNNYLRSIVDNKLRNDSFNLLLANNVNNNSYRLMCVKFEMDYRRIENENLFALEVIETNEKNRLNTEIETKTNSNNSIYNDLRNALSECDGNAFKWSVSGLSEQLEYLDVIELRNILSFMTTCLLPTNLFEPNYYKLWSSLDAELTKRFNSLTIYDSDMQSFSLNIANLFYKLMLCRCTQYNRMLIKKLSAPDIQLNKSQLLHLLFHMNVLRWSDANALARCEPQLLNLIDSMTINETSVVCMAYFKTQIKLSKQMTAKILNKAKLELTRNTDKIALSSILKSLRYSYSYEFKEQYIQLIDHLKDLIITQSYNLIHMLELVYRTGIYDKCLIDNVLSVFRANPYSFRLKEIERILLYVSCFGHSIDHNLLDLISDYIYTNGEVVNLENEKYGVLLVSILHYMCVLNYYPQKLIELCFDSQYLDKLFVLEDPTREFQRDLLTVNTALSIERYPQFENILLSTHRINRLRQWILRNEKSTLGHKTRKTQILNSVFMSLRSEYGSKVRLTHLFPFSSYPNIIITNNDFHEANLILKPDIFKNCKAIFILIYNDYVNSTKIIRGVTGLEIRLLKKLGFDVLVAPFYEFTGFKTHNGLKNKILTMLDNI